MKRKALKAAFPHTVPICLGFLMLGISYGFLMKNEGFSFVYPMLMSLFIFAGSMEFIAVHLLLSPFDPVHTFFLTLMVNARHFFYGITMLEKYKNCGKKKWYLIFGMCDESYSINSTVLPPAAVDRGWFMFFVTFLNHIYWVVGATLGGILGAAVCFNTKGLDFMMTALFVVMLINQWGEMKKRLPVLVGLACSFSCLYIFGPQGFMLPALFFVVICFWMMKKKIREVH